MSGVAEEEDLEGWSTSRVLEWVVVGAVSFPLMAGFVALGTAVVAGRSLRDLARIVWSWVPGRDPVPVPTGSMRRSDAA